MIDRSKPLKQGAFGGFGPMASRRSDAPIDEAWVKAYGEKLGERLGRELVRTIERTLEERLDLGALLKRLAGGRPGRKVRPAGCSEPGCQNPVLARGLCRSHYYKARYKAQKGMRKK
jgi:hypothetical protein